MCVSIDKNKLRLAEFSPRGLVEQREPMTDGISDSRKCPMHIVERKSVKKGITIAKSLA